MVIVDAFLLLLDVKVLLVMAGCAVFGLFVGAVPGFSASMAVALLLPVTYFLDPVPALAGVMELSAMAIFAGDIPGALLRIPGTPASAAYVEDAFKMSQRGEGDLALGIGLICSAIGGIFGAIVLLVAAPTLAQIAVRFSTFEYFWLAIIGLTASLAVSSSGLAKGAISLFLGLVLAMVGLDPVSGLPRFTFGSTELIGGLGFIPVLIGLFALPEVLRYAVNRAPSFQIETSRPTPTLASFRKVWTKIVRVRWSVARGSGIGVIIGAIPGAGADIAGYISYAVARALSKKKSSFGTGIPDGIASASAANNASIGGAMVPATVFGIPGDSLTAIIIGVLFLKGLNPGPLVFIQKGELINAVFLAYLVANLAIVPVGYLAIRTFGKILQLRRSILMPLVLAACIVGSFAVENTTFAMTTMLGAGVIGYYMEENSFPLAPAILGLVLGPLVESTFLTSLIKSDGAFLPFVERPVSALLATIVALVWIFALFRAVRAVRRKPESPEHA